MTGRKIEIIFHNLLNKASSIRNVLHLLLLEKKHSEKKTKYYLEGALENANKLIEDLQKFRQEF